MAGESLVSQGAIEKRAEDLEGKLAEEAAKKETDDAAAVKAEADKKAAEELAKNPPAPQPDKKAPNDPEELRRWNTRVSMELAEVKKGLQNLAESLSKSQKQKVDWKSLAKDPEKLEKAIAAYEKELVDSHSAQLNDQIVQSTAEITQYESDKRFTDTKNYPRWAELMPIMKHLSTPTDAQPSGDPRVNFNRHPKVVLDDLYQLAGQLADADPNWKKPAAAAPSGKTYNQAEFDAAVAKAKEDAVNDHDKRIKDEKNGAGVGSFGKSGPKGKTGDINKEVAWNMPLSSLKEAIQRATDQVNG